MGRFLDYIRDALADRLHRRDPADKRNPVDRLLDELATATRDRNAAAVARIKEELAKLTDGKASGR